MACQRIEMNENGKYKILDVKLFEKAGPIKLPPSKQIAKPSDALETDDCEYTDDMDEYCDYSVNPSENIASQGENPQEQSGRNQNNSHPQNDAELDETLTEFDIRDVLSPSPKKTSIFPNLSIHLTHFNSLYSI